MFVLNSTHFIYIIIY